MSSLILVLVSYPPPSMSTAASLQERLGRPSLFATKLPTLRGFAASPGGGRSRRSRRCGAVAQVGGGLPLHPQRRGSTAAAAWRQLLGGTAAAAGAGEAAGGGWRDSSNGSHDNGRQVAGEDLEGRHLEGSDQRGISGVAADHSRAVCPQLCGSLVESGGDWADGLGVAVGARRFGLWCGEGWKLQAAG